MCIYSGLYGFESFHIPPSSRSDDNDFLSGWKCSHIRKCLSRPTKAILVTNYSMMISCNALNASKVLNHDKPKPDPEDLCPKSLEQSWFFSLCSNMVIVKTVPVLRRHKRTKQSRHEIGQTPSPALASKEKANRASLTEGPGKAV